MLKGYKLLGHFDGTTVSSPKFVITSDLGVTKEVASAYIEWESTDMALLSLLLATLSDKAMEYVLGCRTASEAWINLVDRYASVSKSRVNHLKTELHTIQNVINSIDKYLLQIKNIRDQLTDVGELVCDNDVIIAGLASLPKEYAIIRTVILAKDSTLTLKEFRAQLLGAEKEIEPEINSLSQSLFALYVQGSGSTFHCLVDLHPIHKITVIYLQLLGVSLLRFHMGIHNLLHDIMLLLLFNLII